MTDNQYPLLQVGDDANNPDSFVELKPGLVIENRLFKGGNPQDLQNWDEIKPGMKFGNKVLTGENFSDPASWADDTEEQDPIAARKPKTELDSTLQEMKNPSAAERTLTGTAQDIGIKLTKGLIGVPEALVGLADLATAPTQMASTAISNAVGGLFGMDEQEVKAGRIGKALNDAGFRPKEAKGILDQYLSDAQQAADKKVEDADGFVGTVKALVENPSVAGLTAVESAPQMLLGGGVARTISGGVKQLASEAVEQAGKRISPVVSGALGEGLVGAGAATESIRSETDDGLLSPKQSGAGAATGAFTGLLGAVGGKVAQKIGIGDIDTILAKGGLDTAQKNSKGFLRKAVEGGIVEGVFEELPQSVQEQMLQNYALDKPIMEGVDKVAALGLVTGAGFGVASGGFSKSGDKQASGKKDARSEDGLQGGKDPASGQIQPIDLNEGTGVPDTVRQFMQENEDTYGPLDAKAQQGDGDQATAQSSPTQAQDPLTKASKDLRQRAADQLSAPEDKGPQTFTSRFADQDEPRVASEDAAADAESPESSGLFRSRFETDQDYQDRLYAYASRNKFKSTLNNAPDRDLIPDVRTGPDLTPDGRFKSEFSETDILKQEIASLKNQLGITSDDLSGRLFSSRFESREEQLKRDLQFRRDEASRRAIADDQSNGSQRFVSRFNDDSQQPMLDVDPATAVAVDRLTQSDSALRGEEFVAPTPTQAAAAAAPTSIAEASGITGQQANANTQIASVNGRVEQTAQIQATGPARSPRNLNQVDTAKDSILVAVAKLGGLNVDEQIADGLDPAERNRRAGGLFRVFTKQGRSIDAMGESLADLGYIPRDENGRYDVRDVQDAIDQEMMGNPVFAAEGFEQRAAAQREAEFKESGMANVPAGFEPATAITDDQRSEAVMRLAMAMEDSSPDSPVDLGQVYVGESSNAGIKTMADIFGVKVVEIDAIADTESAFAINGAYDVQSKTIFINRKSGNPDLLVFGHELFHHLENVAPEAAKKLAAIVKKYKRSAEYKKLSEKLIERGYSPDQVNSEVAADTLGLMMGDRRFLNLLARSEPSVFRTVYDQLKNLISAIKAKIDGSQASTEVSRVLNSLEMIRNDMAAVVAELAVDRQFQAQVRAMVQGPAKQELVRNPQGWLDAVPSQAEDFSRAETNFELEQPTPETLQERDAKERSAQRDQERADRESAVAEQDFVLTGSDRDVDQSEARGQQNMFDEQSRPTSELAPASQETDEAQPVDSQDNPKADDQGDTTTISPTANQDGEEILGAQEFKDGSISAFEFFNRNDIPESVLDDLTFNNSELQATQDRASAEFKSNDPLYSLIADIRAELKAQEIKAESADQSTPAKRAAKEARLSKIADAYRELARAEENGHNPIRSELNKMSVKETAAGDALVSGKYSLPENIKAKFLKKSQAVMGDGVSKKGLSDAAQDAKIEFLLEKAQEYKSARPQAQQAELPDNETAQAAGESTAVQANTGAKIDDFGEKLGGARKDRAPSLSEEISKDDIESKPLSKIWPAAEIDKIENPFLAAVATAARAAIPTKPRKGYKLSRWVDQVSTLRGLARTMFNQEISAERFMEMLQAKPALQDMASKIRLMAMVDRKDWGRIGEVRERPNAYSFDKDNNKIPSPFVSVEIDGFSKSFPKTSSVAEIEQQISEALGNDVQAKKLQFEIREVIGGEYFINKKGDREYTKLVKFKTLPEARAYLKDNYADLVSAWDEVKDKKNVSKKDTRGDVNRDRTGPTRREGDVTPEQFESAFGFRGVEFGNWVSQGSGGKDRQGMLNQAYDALLDLAEVIGVTPRAMSLNGTLGLSFGSRGSGNAAAHFEPGNLVINLTKTKGAGSLAHEWFHAMDNYFARQRRDGNAVEMSQAGNTQQGYRENNFITYRPEPMMVYIKQPGERLGTRPMTKAQLKQKQDRHGAKGLFDPARWQADPDAPQGVRVEVERSFAELVEALDNSPMAGRSGMLDKGKADGYWSQIIERGARAFENYVIAKMKEGGYNNDFLANVRTPEDFPRSLDRFPYLLPEELEHVSKAFDNLFDTIQEKQTESGVMLFSRMGDNQSLEQTPAFEQWFGGSTVVDEDGQPAVQYHSTSSDFSEFKVDFGRDSWKKFGAHFGSVEAATNRIEMKAGEDARDGERSGNAAPNIMPVYLSIKNPLRLPENRAGRWGVDDIMRSIMDGADRGTVDVPTKLVDDYYADEMKIDGKLWTEEDPEVQSKMLRSFLSKTLGVDGIVYANEFEGGGDSYIVWDATQVKSATGNNGAFDSKNADIRFSRFPTNDQIDEDAERAERAEDAALRSVLGEVQSTAKAQPTTKTDAGAKPKPGVIDLEEDIDEVYDDIKPEPVKQSLIPKAKNPIDLTPPVLVNSKRMLPAEQGWIDGLYETVFKNPKRMLKDAFVNKYSRLEEVQRGVAKMLKSASMATLKANPMGIVETLPGKISSMSEDILKLEFEPMLKRAKKLGFDSRDIGLFAIAEHAQERNAYILKKFKMENGSGMADDVAKQILAGKEVTFTEQTPEGEGRTFKIPARSPEQLEDISSLTLELRNVASKTRKMMAAYGLESQDTIEKFETVFKYYIPLKSLTEGAETGEVRMPMAEGLSVKGSTVKSPKGRMTIAESVVGQVFAARQSTSDRALTNEAALSVLDFILESEKRGIPLRTNDGSRPLFEVNPQEIMEIVRKGTLDDYRSEAKKWFETSGEKRMGREGRINDSEVALYLSKKAGISPTVEAAERFAASQKGTVLSKAQVDAAFGSDMISVRVAGKDLFIRINDRHTAAQLQELMGKTKNPNAVLKTLKEIGSKNNRWVALVQTGLNPFFWGKSLVWDVVQTGILATQVDSKFAKDALMSLPTAAKASFLTLAGRKSALYESYRKSGAKTGFIQTLRDAGSIERRAAEIAQLQKGSPKKAFAKTFELIGDVGSAIEDIARISVYQAAKKRGMTDQQAAEMGRKISINYNRKGEITEAANAWSVYFNASVQGAYTVYTAAKSPKFWKSAAVISSAYTAMAILLAIQAGEDEDGEAMFNNPAFRRDRQFNILIPTFNPDKEGLQYVKIPIAYGMNLLMAPGNTIASIVAAELYGGDLQGVMANEAITTLGSVSRGLLPAPIGTTVDLFASTGEGEKAAIIGLSPTIAQPFVSIANNMGVFGQKLRPDSIGKNKDDSDLLFKSQMGSGFDKLAKGLAETFGRTEDGPRIDVAPSSLKLFADNYFGFISRAINGNFGQYQFVVSPNSDERGRRTKFYDAIKEIEGSEELYESLKLEGKSRAASEYARDNRLVSTSKYGLNLKSKGGKVREALGDFQDKKVAIRNNDSMTDQMKELRIREIEKSEDRLVTGFLQQYNRATGRSD